MLKIIERESLGERRETMSFRGRRVVRRFQTPQHEELFRLAYSQRVVLLERRIQLSEYADYSICQNFHQRGWESLLRVQGSVTPDRVREFYAYCRRPGVSTHVLISTVRKVDVTITTARIARALGVPRVFEQEYSPSLILSNHQIRRELQAVYTPWEGARLPVSSLKREYQFLNIIVSANILPTIWDRDYIDESRARMLYIIGTGISIDLPQLILDHMFACKRDDHVIHQVGLPYGIMIDRILEEHGVPRFPEEFEQSSGSLISGMDVSFERPLLYGPPPPTIPSHVSSSLYPGPQPVPPPYSVLQEQIVQLRNEVAQLRAQLGVEAPSTDPPPETSEEPLTLAAPAA